MNKSESDEFQNKKPMFSRVIERMSQNWTFSAFCDFDENAEKVQNWTKAEFCDIPSVKPINIEKIWLKIGQNRCFSPKITQNFKTSPECEI